MSTDATLVCTDGVTFDGDLATVPWWYETLADGTEAPEQEESVATYRWRRPAGRPGDNDVSYEVELVSHTGVEPTTAVDDALRAEVEGEISHHLYQQQQRQDW